MEGEQKIEKKDKLIQELQSINAEMISLEEKLAQLRTKNEWATREINYLLNGKYD